jgi:hypothetical protein
MSWPNVNLKFHFCRDENITGTFWDNASYHVDIKLAGHEGFDPRMSHRFLDHNRRAGAGIVCITFVIAMRQFSAVRFHIFSGSKRPLAFGHGGVALGLPRSFVIYPRLAPASLTPNGLDRF